MVDMLEHNWFHLAGYVIHAEIDNVKEIVVGNLTLFLGEQEDIDFFREIDRPLDNLWNPSMEAPEIKFIFDDNKFNGQTDRLPFTELTPHNFEGLVNHFADVTGHIEFDNSDPDLTAFVFIAHSMSID